MRRKHLAVLFGSLPAFCLSVSRRAFNADSLEDTAGFCLPGGTAWLKAGADTGCVGARKLVADNGREPGWLGTNNAGFGPG